MRNLISGLALAVSTCLAASAHAQTPAPPTEAQTAVRAAWWTGFLAKVQPVKLPDGRVAELYCEGRGAPAVVLDSGLGDGAWSWSLAQDALAAKTRVCAFNRAGYGQSTLGAAPRDTQAIVDDMADMLKAGGVKGPYVMVGHSMASFDVRLFALTHRKDLAGLVLVDPSGDWQFERMGKVAPRQLTAIDASLRFFNACAQDPRPVVIEKLCAPPPHPDLPAAVQAYLVKGSGRDYYRAQAGEEVAMGKIDNEQLVAARTALGERPLGDRPLVVLTRGEDAKASPEDAAAFKIWITMHDEMAALSSRGVNRMVDGASHHIQDDRPQVVIDAINEVVDAARHRRP